MAKYTVVKTTNRFINGWVVQDAEGYDVSYVVYDTKKEALFAAHVRTKDDKEHLRRTKQEYRSL